MKKKTRSEKAAASPQERLQLLRQELKLSMKSCILLMSALAMLALSSFAWFSSNREIRSSGINAQIAVSPNLIISRSNDNSGNSIQTMNLAASPFAVSFDEAEFTLRPATHDKTSETYTPTSVSHLQYNTNPTAVDPVSGLGSGLNFATVEYSDTNASSYYRDYVVYIASAGVPFTAANLNATISIQSGSGDPPSSLPDYWNAASIDFYMKATSHDSADGASFAYAGTLNVAGKGSGGASITTLDLIPTESLTIPLNTSGYITVLMRFYFDGGLLKDQNQAQAYVYSNAISVQDYDVSVSFEAVDVGSVAAVAAQTVNAGTESESAAETGASEGEANAEGGSTEEAGSDA